MSIKKETYKNMSVKIRMARIGRNMTSEYRIIVTDSRKAANGGSCIEQIGHFDSSKDFTDAVIDEEKALYWLGKGAQPSDTMRAMLQAKGILAKFFAAKKAAKKPVEKKAVKKPAVKAAVKPAEAKPADSKKAA
jgi:small subunit ribosomal protein S16